MLETINGVAVIHEFKVHHHEWECDGYGWVTEDGRIWLSSHGNVYESNADEIKDKIDELTKAISGLNEAIRLHLKDKLPNTLTELNLEHIYEDLDNFDVVSIDTLLLLACGVNSITTWHEVGSDADKQQTEFVDKIKLAIKHRTY